MASTDEKTIKLLTVLLHPSVTDGEAIAALMIIRRKKLTLEGLKLLLSGYKENERKNTIIVKRNYGQNPFNDEFEGRLREAMRARWSETGTSTSQYGFNFKIHL